MKCIKDNLANAITLGNLMSGCIAVLFMVSGDYDTVVLCILFSLILDFFDGFVARALKANSPLGTQLDSLADMVSFGLVPGMAMYKMLLPFGNELMGITLPFDLCYLGFFITLFSCLRLAIFNLDEEQKYYFKGLNTPSNTLFIVGILYSSHHLFFESVSGSALALLGLTALSSWLLVSPIKMIAMKFRSKRLQDNYPALALVLGAVVLLSVYQLAGIPLIILYYLFISLMFRKQIRN